MTEGRRDATGPIPPQPDVRKRRWHISLVWLIPIVAAIVGLSMLVRDWQQSGPTIEIQFRTAEGLSPGQTSVQYRSVEIGQVTAVELSEDREHAIATVALNKNAQAFTAEDSRFWVVRPRVNKMGVSGLDTLFSGGFIAADAGRSEQTSERFTGLETPPAVTYGEPGTTVQLQAGTLGSLIVGSPVYFRKVEVGRVVAYELADDGDFVNVDVFVEAPHDRHVTDNTRFWNASGIDLNVGTSGVEVDIESLVSVVTGGIAFGEPPGPQPDTTTASEATGGRTTLFESREAALAPDKGLAQSIRMRFEQPLQNLEEGAPVDFLGRTIGEVSRVALDYDDSDKSFPVIVEASVYPQMMGEAFEKLREAMGAEPGDTTVGRRLFEDFVGRGLRAEARSGNLLTGKRYVALEFYPDDDKVAPESDPDFVAIPTRATSFDQIQTQLVDLLDEVSEIPFESIAGNLDGSLAELQATLGQVNNDVLPATLETMQGINDVMQNMEQALEASMDTLGRDSPEREQLRRVLNELERMSRSVRELSDSVRQQPESLLRGRQTPDRSGLEP